MRSFSADPSQLAHRQCISNRSTQDTVSAQRIVLGVHSTVPLPTLILDLLELLIRECNFGFSRNVFPRTLITLSISIVLSS